MWSRADTGRKKFPLPLVRCSTYQEEVSREEVDFYICRGSGDRGRLVPALVTVQAADQTVPGAGQVAPTFTLPSQDGSQISLDSFRGKWVVLYFYPKDMTQGCTIEAHNFQRDLSKFEAANAVIVGVSVDTPDSHKQFCTKEGLTFRLLADPEHKVVDEYGSLGHFGA